MESKPRPHHRLYLEILAKMTPTEKFQKIAEMNALTRALFREGIRRAFPDRTPEELERIYRERMAKCHSRNY